VGLLGEDGSLPALEKRAGLEDARTACVAVQAISALGGAKAQASLERLKSSAPCLEARAQCKFLLDALFYPFQGDQADPRMLQAFEASKDQALKYAIPGGWFAAGERILRRWIRDRRADLVPKLREIADRQVAANRAVLDNPTDTYLRQGNDGGHVTALRFVTSTGASMRSQSRRLGDRSLDRGGRLG
jgi:hypothetical protein